MLLQAPGLGLGDDLGLYHHRLPWSHLFPQQIVHNGGELGLCLDDLRRLLIHQQSTGIMTQISNLISLL